MSRLSSVVKQHPLIAFFLLTYALTWLAWPMWASGLYPIAPVFSFAPFLAALVVLAITQGKSGVGALLRRMNVQASALDMRLRRHAENSASWHAKWDDPQGLTNTHPATPAHPSA